MNPPKIYILLGGLWGWDSFIDSRGMLDLADKLQALGFSVTTLNWTDYAQVDQGPAAKIVIGYSGGGSRATYLVKPIELLVLYDPSPAWQMGNKGICGKNVAKATCYHNTQPKPENGELGGGVLTGPQVTSIDIAEDHLAVQYDAVLHNLTIEACKQLLPTS